MTTHRRYHFECPYSQDLQQALQVLEMQCNEHWWYEAPYVEPVDSGFKFGFTVHARDQWWCHRRATALASVVYEVLKISPLKLPVPLWTGFAPHSNRGFY